MNKKEIEKMFEERYGNITELKKTFSSKVKHIHKDYNYTSAPDEEDISQLESEYNTVKTTQTLYQDLLEFIFQTIIPEVLKSILPMKIEYPNRPNAPVDTEEYTEAELLRINKGYNLCLKEIKQNVKDLFNIDL